jgi:hypothetical protein|tara:strand:- start:1358 stop:1594 length:237 start_codon:yes stop_codon:yes gene_type:complete
MGKQQLSAKGARDKKIRDLACANTKDRKAKRAENQRIGQRPDSDIHHIGGVLGKVVRRSIKSNRGNNGNGTKNETQNA